MIVNYILLEFSTAALREPFLYTFNSQPKIIHRPVQFSCMAEVALVILGVHTHNNYPECQCCHVAHRHSPQEGLDVAFFCHDRAVSNCLIL